MNESFKDAKLKLKETFEWKTVVGAQTATTTRGLYVIRNGLLFFTPVHGVERRLGKFKDPKEKARKHFNTEAI